jgi:hypothetical protein
LSTVEIARLAEWAGHAGDAPRASITDD